MSGRRSKRERRTVNVPDLLHRPSFCQCEVGNGLPHVRGTRCDEWADMWRQALRGNFGEGA